MEIFPIAPTYVYIQSTTPTDLTAGKLWYNTSSNLLYASNGSSYVLVANVDLTYLQNVAQDNSVSILELEATATITGGQNTYMLRDFYNDNTGYLNTVDTAGCTAKYLSNSRWINYSSPLASVGEYAFEEQSGTSCANFGSGGSVMNGLIAGNWTTSGKFRGGYSPNDDTDATCGISANTLNSSGFSFSFWIKRSGNLIADDIILSNTTGVTPASNGLLTISVKTATTDTIVLRFRDNTSAKVTNDIVLTDETWTHLAFTVSGTELVCYKDGSAVGSPVAISSPTLSNATGFHIFAGTGGGGKLQACTVDSLRLHSGVLSSGNVTTIYSATTESANQMVKTSATTVSSGYNRFQCYTYKKTTTGSGSVTYDVSFDGGSNYQTGIAENTVTTITNPGTSLIVKQNLNGTTATSGAKTGGYAIMFWTV